MIVGVLKEAAPETRVSLIAEGAAQLIKKNISVWIESGAGMNAYCSDDDYRAVGAEIISAEEIAAKADVVQGSYLPGTIILDKQHRVAAKFIGPVNKEDLSRILNQLASE